MMNPVWQIDPNELLAEIIDEFTGVVGFAELMQTDSERSKEYAAEVLHSAERALDLVRSLSAKLLHPPNPPRRCQVNSVVLDLEPSFRRVVGQSIPLAVRISPNFDSIPMSRRDLEALLLYLVAAARDAYSNSSLGPIRVRTSRVTHSDGSRSARIVVEDEAGPPQTGDMRWFLLGQGPTDLLNALTPFVERARDAGGSVRVESRPGDPATVVSVEFPIDGTRHVSSDGGVQTSLHSVD